MFDKKTEASLENYETGQPRKRFLRQSLTPSGSCVEDAKNIH